MNVTQKLLLPLFIFGIALSGCGGNSTDVEDAEQGFDESAVRAWGPWGSCTLIRDGLKVPGYWDAASRCCCYNGDCERQLVGGAILSVGP